MDNFDNLFNSLYSQATKTTTSKKDWIFDVDVGNNHPTHYDLFNGLVTEWKDGDWYRSSIPEEELKELRDQRDSKVLGWD